MNLASSSRGHSQRYLRQLLADHGLAPRSSLGQCFLTDLNLLGVLVEAAELTRSDFVLEVGAGTGSLTQRLATRAGSVLSVEIDRGLYQLAIQAVQQFPNVRVIEADILERKNALNSVVIGAIEEMAPTSTSLRRKVVANLPYVVATPVISLLLLDERPWELMVITIQKELADRLMARPGTKEYGSLSVLVQSLSDVQLLRELPPSVFWPRPKVSSAFVRLEPCAPKRSAIGDLAKFAGFTRRVMLHRRKVLRSAMAGVFCGVSKQEIDEFLLRMGFNLRTRAEALAPDEFVRLANGLPGDWVLQI